jgi:hypothetical protein
MRYLAMIDTICQTYVNLNTSDEDYFDPELQNRRAELFLELSKSMMIVFGETGEEYEQIVKNMIHYVENSQFFNVQDEVVRVLLCDDNMEVNALRILFFSLVRSLKERTEGDLDSVDETYYEDNDVIYMNKEDVEEDSSEDEE